MESMDIKVTNSHKTQMWGMDPVILAFLSISAIIGVVFIVILMGLAVCIKLKHQDILRENEERLRAEQTKKDHFKNSLMDKWKESQTSIQSREQLLCKEYSSHSSLFSQPLPGIWDEATCAVCLCNFYKMNNANSDDEDGVVEVSQPQPSAERLLTRVERIKRMITGTPERKRSLSDSTSEGPVLFLKDCGHYFHFDCAWQWLDLCRKCPICRTSVAFSFDDMVALSVTDLRSPAILTYWSDALSQSRRRHYSLSSLYSVNSSSSVDILSKRRLRQTLDSRLGVKIGAKKTPSLFTLYHFNRAAHQRQLESSAADDLSFASTSASDGRPERRPTQISDSLSVRRVAMKRNAARMIKRHTMHSLISRTSARVHPMKSPPLHIHGADSVSTSPPPGLV